MARHSRYAPQVAAEASAVRITNDLKFGHTKSPFISTPRTTASRVKTTCDQNRPATMASRNPGIVFHFMSASITALRLPPPDRSFPPAPSCHSARDPGLHTYPQPQGPGSGSIAMPKTVALDECAGSTPISKSTNGPSSPLVEMWKCWSGSPLRATKFAMRWSSSAGANSNVSPTQRSVLLSTSILMPAF